MALSATKGSFSRIFYSNLDILNVLGPISMKIGMYCPETLFQNIPINIAYTL